MKQILFALLASTGLGLLAFNVNELPIGAAMPKGDVLMKDISGKEISLNQAKKENGLLVMFSCNTCPVVIKNQQRTNEICSYALKQNIGVVLLNSNEGQRDQDDSFNAMVAYAKKNDFKWFYTIDARSELADAFGAKKTPECYLFDNKGKLVYHGAIDDNPGNAEDVKRTHLKEAIDEVVQNKSVSVTTSRAVGCTIKRKG